MFFKPSLWSGPQHIQSHRSLALQRAEDLDRVFLTGQFRPYIWPWDAAGIFLMIAYMLAPPNKSRLYFLARYPCFAYCSYLCIRVIFKCRSKSPPTAYGLGLLHAFALAWMAFHLLWRDTRTESVLIAWKEDGGEATRPANRVENDESSTVGVAMNGGSARHVIERRTENGNVKSNSSSHASELLSSPTTTTGPSRRTYYWQSLPSDFISRFNWVMAMILTLRGEGTSHGITSLPSPPASIQSSLRHNSPNIPPPRWITDHRTSYLTHRTRLETSIYFLSLYLRTYLILDLMMLIIRRDPYYLGLAPLSSPLTPSLTSSPILKPLISLLPATILNSPTFPRFCRLLLSSASMLTLLTHLTALPPLLAYGLLNLRPEPSLYPSVFGSSYLRTIGSTGIAGWWGLWWHQMFRLPFSAPLKPLCSLLNIPVRSSTGRMLGVVLAFGLSGVLHASGSYTALGDSYPWSGSAAFFWLQPVGIAVEMGFKNWTKETSVGRRVMRGTPEWIRKGLVLVWVHGWLYVTGPLMADDCARAGVWLTEPVPVSIVEGLLGNGWVKWESWVLPGWQWGDGIFSTGVVV